MADNLDIGGDRLVEVGDGLGVVRDALLEPGIGLRNVGPGALADIQPVLRRAELLAQELDVLGGQVDHDLGADHVHEGGDRVEEHVRTRPPSTARVPP